MIIYLVPLKIQHALRVSDNTEVYKSDHLLELSQNSHLTHEGNSVSRQKQFSKMLVKQDSLWIALGEVARSHLN